MAEREKGPSPVAKGKKPQAEKNRGGKCPICGKPRSAEYRPFCSKRCADVDLGRWLSESYAIPLPEYEIDSESE